MNAHATIDIKAPVQKVFDAFSWELIAPVDPLIQAQLDALDGLEGGPAAPPPSRVTVKERVRDQKLVLTETNDAMQSTSTYAFTASAAGTQVSVDLDVDLSHYAWWQRWWIGIMFRASVKRDLTEELDRIRELIESGAFDD